MDSSRTPRTRGWTRSRCFNKSTHRQLRRWSWQQWITYANASSGCRPRRPPTIRFLIQSPILQRRRDANATSRRLQPLPALASSLISSMRLGCGNGPQLGQITPDQLQSPPSPQDYSNHSFSTNSNECISLLSFDRNTSLDSHFLFFLSVVCYRELVFFCFWEKDNEMCRKACKYVGWCVFVWLRRR